MRKCMPPATAVEYRQRVEDVPVPHAVELGDSCYVLVSEEGLERAVKTAVEGVVGALSKALDLDWHDAYMLASLATDVEVSQLVDPCKTVRVRVPKDLVPPVELLRALSRA